MHRLNKVVTISFCEIKSKWKNDEADGRNGSYEDENSEGDLLTNSVRSMLQFDACTDLHG